MVGNPPLLISNCCARVSRLAHSASRQEKIAMVMERRRMILAYPDRFARLAADVYTIKRRRSPFGKRRRMTFCSTQKRGDKSLPSRLSE
jgi:hypothetical protein